MKVLIYGFKPYKNYKENITEKVIKKIKKKKNLIKVIFPVKFEKEIFLRKIKKFKPDVVLGLGQHPRSKKIRIERKAINLKGKNKKTKLKIVSKDKQKYLFVNLKLKKDRNSWISYNAGKYVCNFSMYIILDFIKNKDIRFAFIHLPKSNLNKAMRFVENKIEENFN